MLGFGFYRDQYRSKALYFSIFVLANILSWPYILENIWTLVAHVLAFLCACGTALITDFKPAEVRYAPVAREDRTVGADNENESADES